MKKRIKYLTTLLLLPLLFSCNNENISTETKIVESSSEEVTLSKLQVLNSENEFCYVGDIYSHSTDLIVNAIYSDSTVVNVTNLCKFSTINTETADKKLVSVYYLNKSTVYVVDVRNPIESYLEVDTKNIKQTYNVGEKIDLKDLVVTVHYNNNTKRVVDNYEYSLTDEYNNSVNPLEIDRVGRIDVKISFGNISKSFSIFSKGSYDVGYTMRYQALDELYDTAIGYHNFVDNDYIMQSPYFKLIANSSKLTRVDNKNNPLSEKYNDINYFEAINLSKDGGAKFELTHNAIVSFLVKASETTNILISNLSSEETQITKFQSIDFTSNLKLISTYLTQGIYQLDTLNGEAYLFENNIYISDTTIDNVKTYKSLGLELGHVKKEFVDEAFNYDGLYVKGIYDNGAYDSILPSDYKVELIYNNKVVDNFKLSGEYIVQITYIGLNPTLDFRTSYKVTYSNTKQYERNQFESITVNGQNVSFGQTEATDLYGSVTISGTNTATVLFTLIDPTNSVLYIDGIKYTNIAELNVSNSKTFEFSVEYKDAEDNTIYYIKYLITINKE